MMLRALRFAGLLILATLVTVPTTGPGKAENDLCIDCLRVRVGPPVVVRGPFPDELDSTFTALKLADGSFRGFSANGATYAIDGTSLSDMHGPRREVISVGETGGPADCGHWLNTAMRSGDEIFGFVHQESDCDYSEGRTHKSMAIAASSDDGLSWSAPDTVITGRDAPQPGQITGEGDCTMINGQDGYLYAYCLRNSDWQTIAARASVTEPTVWQKYYQGAWSEPGLGGNATAIGFFGPGAAYIPVHDWVATVTPDPWFEGVRMSLSTDKISFVDMRDPLIAIDGSEWARPADTALHAYATLLNPSDGSNTIAQDFLLSYIYIPPNKGFKSRYLVHHEVSLSVEETPQQVQAGIALTRWIDAKQDTYVTSTGPMTGDRHSFQQDAVVAHMLTRAPDGLDSIKYAECARVSGGRLDHMLMVDERCPEDGFVRERTAGWLFATEQPGSVPVYHCLNAASQSHFASNDPDCEGLGDVETLLGYGLAS